MYFIKKLHKDISCIMLRYIDTNRQMRVDIARRIQIINTAFLPVINL